jgi:hypothetical protein
MPEHARHGASADPLSNAPGRATANKRTVQLAASMRVARLAILSLLAAAALILIAELILLAIDARRKLDGLSDYLTSQQKEVAGILYQAHSALLDIHAIQTDTTRTEAEMAGLLNQTRHSMMTPAQTAELVGEASQLIRSATAATDEMGAAANSLKGIAPTAEGAISQLADDSHAAMIEATADLRDPSIQLTTAGLARTAENTAETTKNLADTTADIKEYVHRETTPVRGTWHLVKEFLYELAGPLASVATAAK